MLSMVTAASLTLIWTEYGDTACHALGWVEKTQIVAAGTITVGALQLLLWMAVGLVFGRVYCSGICPLGTWFDIVSRLGITTRRHLKKSCHYSYSTPLNRTRYTILSISLACLAAGLTFLPRLIEPSSMWHDFCSTSLHTLWGHINNLLASLNLPSDPTDRVAFVAITGASVSAIALSTLILLAASIPAWNNGRTYCNTVCPIGATLSIASRYSTWRVDIDTDLCINCGKCSDACKASCIDLNDHVVDMSRCVNCYDCLTVCPNAAIFYRPSRKQLSWPLMQSTRPSFDANTPPASSSSNMKSTSRQ